MPMFQEPSFQFSQIMVPFMDYYYYATFPPYDTHEYNCLTKHKYSAFNDNYILVSNYLYKQ